MRHWRRRPAWTMRLRNSSRRYAAAISNSPAGSPSAFASSMRARQSKLWLSEFGKSSDRMFEDFHGNAHAVETLSRMIERQRIPQTLLFSGPEGVGKATLARRFAAAVLPNPGRIELDDLSLPDNLETIAGREKWTAEKRNEDPLLFASHPDFVTFAPDGPLRQLSIPQMRALKERAHFLPNKGAGRVFLIDHIDRSGD